MYFDRFDICSAYYCFLSEYHDGQFSDKYRRLSRLLTHFSPGAGLGSSDDLEGNARAIYDALIEKENTYLAEEV